MKYNLEVFIFTGSQLFLTANYRRAIDSPSKIIASCLEGEVLKILTIPKGIHFLAGEQNVNSGSVIVELQFS